MTFDRFGDPNTEGTFASDMERARGYKPITEDDLKKGYSQYSEVGAKFGVVKKTDSDTVLYNKAKKYVLDWWKKEKTDAAALDKPPTSGGGGGPVSGGRPTGGAAGGPSGSGGGSYVGGMPDTAMGSGGPAAPLNTIAQRVAVNTPTYAAAREGTATTAQKVAVPLTSTQVTAIMKQMGASTAWNPPAYARASEAALEDWITKAATNAQLTLIANSTPVFNDAYVAQVIKNLGITNITAKSVPIAYRRSALTLKNYLLQQQAAYRLRLANMTRMASSV